MNRIGRTVKFLVLVHAICALSATAADADKLNEHLEPLRPYLKTWKGEFKNSTPQNPIVDVMKWERILNGQGIRILHSINQGNYGGETIVFWDSKAGKLAYYYFTTGGFMTTGTLEIKDGRLITHEEVKGEAGGVTAVRGTSKLLSNGRFEVKTEYLKNGEWTPGRDTIYEEDSKAEVVFK